MYYDLVLVFRKSLQDAISGSNRIWAGKWNSYIKKCFTNRRILGTGSKHIFCRIVDHILKSVFSRCYGAIFVIFCRMVKTLNLKP